jgi:hypothetical protein
MRVWLAAVLVLGVALQQTADPIARLNAWFAAVERHQPGTADAWAHGIGTWSSFELRELSADLAIFLEALDQAHLFKPRMRPWPRPSRPRPRNVVNAIRALAGELVRRGDVSTSNEFLKRAALLHADIAMLVPFEPGVLAPPARSANPRSARAPRSSERLVVQTEDGLLLGVEYATRHWQIGRTVIEAVAPDAARDDTARLWYRATMVYLLREEQFGDAYPHMKAALDAIAGDARLLFYAGAMHETFASGSAQAVARALESRVDLRSDVRSMEDELEKAETFFRKSLIADPQFSEARLRLGRVLGLLGRHQEAGAELRQTIPQLKDSRLVYYGELFLGHEEAAMRRRLAAQEHFERAAALYPRAQSPRLSCCSPRAPVPAALNSRPSRRKPKRCGLTCWSPRTAARCSA